MTDLLDRAVDAAIDGMPKPERTTQPRQNTASTANSSHGVAPVDELIRRGEKSPNVRTRRAAERARQAVDALRAALEIERAEGEAADAVAALEKQLEEAKEKLRRVRRRRTARTVSATEEPGPRAVQKTQLPRVVPGRQPTVVPTRTYQVGVDYVASTVRAWARENGWAHPRMGRFCPPALVAQYLSDTGGEP